VASWFTGKRKETDEDVVGMDAVAPPAEPAVEDSTIEVRAQVIADAVQAGPVVEQAPRTPLSTTELSTSDVNGEELVDDFRVEPVLSVAPELYDQALDERRSLVALCLYAHDRARSSGVAERIEEGLASVGVTALRPGGDRFDPSVHEAGGTVGTEDVALDGTVAETEVVGFGDRGQVLRPPIVTVYTVKAITA